MAPKRQLGIPIGDSNPIKVLFLAGFGRSGTTILANLLGQTGGFISVGEMYMMWEAVLTRPNPCGCGEPVPECPFWTEVFQRAFGGLDESLRTELEGLLTKFGRTRHFPARRASRSKSSDEAGLVRLKGALEKLYRAIQEASGAEVIVDSSKRPVYGRLLAEVPGIELRALHMVRDPRAVAFSWSRRKFHPLTGRPTVRMGPVKSSLLWSGLNLVAEQMLAGTPSESAYQLLKYEDFAAHPRQAYHRTLGGWDLPNGRDPFINDSAVDIRMSHNIAGNMVRFATGRVEIAPDLEWMQRMSVARRGLITGLCWPLMMRYGYPLFRNSNLAD